MCIRDRITLGGSFVITVPGVLLFVGSSEEFLDFDFPLQLHHAVKQRFRTCLLYTSTQATTAAYNEVKAPT